MSRNGPGQCGCGVTGEYNACIAYASKPFSGWPALNTLGLNGDWTSTTHYLTYTCTITQTWDVEWLASDGSTILNSFTRSKTRTVTARRNRWTNDQTIEIGWSGDETGVFWGALNFIPATGDFYGFVWAFNSDNFSNPDGEDFIGNEGGMYFNVISPYLAFYGSFMCVDSSYFIPGVPSSVPPGARAWKNEVTFWEGGNPLAPDGFTKNHVTIEIIEQQSNAYTLSDCKTDQAALVAANTITRLREKSLAGITETYVGYNDSGDIVYADLGDASTPFYPYALLGDPRMPWEEISSVRNFVPWDYKLEGYAALNVATPIVASYGGNPLELCLESKRMFIETGGTAYTLRTYSWSDNSAIGSEAGLSTWTGVSGRGVEITCEAGYGKVIE